MTESLVTLDIQGAVATITLNRPKVMNALSLQMRKELVAALYDIKANADVRSVVLTGSGKAFCAGLDLHELQEVKQSDYVSGIIGKELLDVLAEMDCPVIAAVNGPAITGGLELILCCDVIIASDQAIFADTHAKVGIVPGWGITQKLPALIGPYRAKEISLSGRKIDAQTAYEWGLVNHVVEHDQLLQEAIAMGHDMAECDAGSQQAIKSLIDVGWTSSIEEGLAMEQTTSVQAFRMYLQNHK